MKKNGIPQIPVIDEINNVLQHSAGGKHFRVDYIDTEWIKVSFSSLVIRADSINRIFGSANSFIRDHKLFAKTNGKLVVLSEMMEPPPWTPGSDP